MEIRPAVEEDIPAIVRLLKSSLGETLMPKSEGYWRWKHLMNPFGKSPVLLSLDSSAIVGVRAFMRWEWMHGANVYAAIRAVDTATHPDYQGKGIFRKLTLSLVDKCEAQGDAFVYNTPNEKSKAGYLKMGWQLAGRLPVRVSIRRPFGILRNLVAKQDAEEETLETDERLTYFLNHPRLEDIVSGNDGDRIVTNVSPAYLRWRYLDVPVVKYEAVGIESGRNIDCLIIGRIKNSKAGREFRITDVFKKPGTDRSILMKMFNDKMKERNIHFVTLSGTCATSNNLGSYKFSVPIGPMVTIRSLTLKDLNLLTGFHKWSPSLGDLELF